MNYIKKKIEYTTLDKNISDEITSLRNKRIFQNIKKLESKKVLLLTGSAHRPGLLELLENQ